MSDLKVDGIIASTGTNTALTLQGKGTGTVDIGDGALSFPDADGSANQVISTTGSGVLQFATPSPSWVLIGTSEASTTASLTITGLDSTYDTYAIAVSGMLPITDDVVLWMRLGDSSGIDSGASDYGWATSGMHVTNTTGTETMLQDNADAQIVLADDASTNHIGGAAGEGVGALVFLHCPGDSAVYPIVSGHFIFLDNATRPVIGTVGGARLSAITLDRVQVLFSSGSIEVGRLTVWGLAHA